MNHAISALTLVMLLTPASASAAGKCVTPGGKVTYTERGCPAGSSAVRLKSDPPPKALADASATRTGAYAGASRPAPALKPALPAAGLPHR